ncbi:MAG: nucleotidyltransferase domain-containing protein [Aigarchaeota archaeon]|nr:nucleotidyltransferase domain-containing protein [Candidatus Geocrenenecus dongiae]
MNEYDIVKKYVEKVSRHVKLHVAILFGSRARGDHGPWSDYDILLIGDFTEDYMERLKKLMELANDIKIPIEPHPYRLEEAITMLEKGNPTIVDAVEEGVVVEAGEEYEKLLSKYREMKNSGKLQRTKTTITF